MNIILVFPRIKYGEHSPPLGLGYIASVLEKNGYTVSIVDLTFEKSFDFLEKRLKELKPNLVGITCQTTFAEEAFKAVKISKRILPKTVVVLGGPHPTVLPLRTLQETEADIVVIGEGEYTVKEIVERIKENRSPKEVKGIYYKEAKGITFSGNREFIKDLDEIPFPARHLFDKRYFEYPEITMINSRGCPFNCSFCQPTLKKLFGKKIRLRSPENIIDEIKLILKTYGNKRIRFHDDTFTWNREWVKRLCNLIKKENLKFTWNCKSRVDVFDRELVKILKQAGCVSVDLGIESGSQRILDEILNKNVFVEQIKETFKICYEEGMETLGFIMVGAPTETPQEILDTINLIEKAEIRNLHVSIFTPFPGTRIFDYALEKRLITAKSWDDYDFYSKVSLKSKYFTTQEIKSMKIIMEKKFMLNKLFKSPSGLLKFSVKHPYTFLSYLVNWLKFKKFKDLLKRKLS